MREISARWAIRLQFAIASFGFGLWALRVAEFRQETGLSHSALGLLLLLAPISLQLTLTQIPKISRLIGTKRMLSFGSALLNLSIVSLSLFPPYPLIAVSFIFMGIAFAILEIGLNTICQKLDRESGELLLSAHGFWSIGLMAGMVVAGMLAQAGMGFFTQEWLLAPILIALCFWLMRPLPAAQPSSHGQNTALPTWALLPFCLIPFSALFFEGAVTDWGSVFLSEERGTTPAQTGLISGFFMGGMAFSRLIGDRLRKSNSIRFLLNISTTLGIIGLALFAGSHHSLLILIGALIGGLGSGMVYPLALLLANEGRSEAEASGTIAIVASVSFISFLVAPPFMGFIGDIASLGVGFLCLIPLTALSFLWIKLAGSKR